MAYNLLKGKKGIIFGALNDKSIAWKIAERALCMKGLNCTYQYSGGHASG